MTPLHRRSSRPTPGRRVAPRRRRRSRHPLGAARPALRQWDVHVDAMNKLVVGEITLQQATTFWNQTRVGAQRNVDRFQKAWSALERTGVDCPAPALLGPAPAAVRSCSRLVEAELGVARTARTSIDTWDTHVQHMDMLRMGVLSPEKATEMWLSMWRRGMRDLDAYRAAARNPALDVECPDPGLRRLSVRWRTASRTRSSIACSPALTCSARNPMKPPSLAASAAACALRQQPRAVRRRLLGGRLGGHDRHHRAELGDHLAPRPPAPSACTP